MRTTMTSSRASGVAVGVLAGLAIAYFAPHEATYATTSDRDAEFVMVTVPIENQAAANEPLDAVFMLDFVTEQIKGGAINPKVGSFTSFWMRDLAKDFHVPAGVKPRYCIVSGHLQMPAGKGVNFASGVLYVGELTTGKVNAYGIPRNLPGGAQVAALTPLDTFPFRQPVNLR